MLFGTATFLGGPAFAGSFTFTGTDQVTARVVTSDARGQRTATTFVSVTRQLIAPGNIVTAATGTCTIDDAPAPTYFATIGFCDLEDVTGRFTATFVCKAATARSATTTCTGDLQGKSGTYAGRAGSISWTADADDAVRAATGSGTWD